MPGLKRSKFAAGKLQVSQSEFVYFCIPSGALCSTLERGIYGKMQGERGGLYLKEGERGIVEFFGTYLATNLVCYCCVYMHLMYFIQMNICKPVLLHVHVSDPFVISGLRSEDPVGRAAFKVAIWKTFWRYRVTGTEEQVSEKVFPITVCTTCYCPSKKLRFELFWKKKY